jgi:hypothetical protein
MTALIKHRGYISYNGVTYNEKRTITKTVLLDSSTANPFIFVDGLLVNVKMYLPTLTGLTAISDARQPSGGGTSSNGSLLSQLTAGSVVDLGGFNGLAQVYDGDADGIPEHRVGFFWTTNGSWSPNSYITIQAEYYPFPADAESRALIAENANLVNLNRLQFTGRTFANLGTPANGTFYYCTDCTEADPCAGSGTGAFARRLNNRWKCN